MYLLTRTERKFGLGSISLVIGCNAARVLPNKPRRILKESLAKVMLPPLLTTMGTEFSKLAVPLEKTLAADVYFANPYKSGQARQE